MTRFLICSFLLISLNWMACNETEVRSPEMDNYDLISTSDPDLFEAELKNIDDQLIEKGFFYKGQKDGTWVKFGENGKKISEISSYHMGKLNGLCVKLDKSGRIEERMEFRDGRLHGYYELYQYSKLLKEAHYKDGQLHGRMTKYIEIKGHKLSEADYKEGKLHGVFRYFNDEGDVTLEYRYENGEKVVDEE